MLRTSFPIPASGALHLPIADSETLWYIRVRVKKDGDETELGCFRIGLAGGQPVPGTRDFYVPLWLKGFEGGEVFLSCDDPDAPAALFDGILSGGGYEREDLYPELYREAQRQQLHFSSRRGWLNDPNGLVWIDGKYHMCYQHNPFGQEHGGVNVSWGLAVSEDGVRFTEYPDAVRPRDSLTHIASGSALADPEGRAGFGKNAVIAAYTALASRQFEKNTEIAMSQTRGQMIEISTDGGFRFFPIPEDPVIPVPRGEFWRDPKLLRLDDGSFCLAVYETFEGKNCVSFYSSPDARHWTFRSRTPDLYECPDLFRLRISGTEKKRWVLYGANGKYRIGSFENYAFTQEGESHWIDYGGSVYAGQTWNGTPGEEERFHIAWVRDGGWCSKPDPEQKGRGFSQFMSLACVFTLHETADGFRLFRAPVPALDSLRDGAPRFVRAGELALPECGDVLVSLRSDADFSVRIDTVGFSYVAAERRFRFTSEKDFVLPELPEKIELRIVSDRRSVEFFLCSQCSATWALPLREKLLHFEGAETPEWKVFRMRSIWEEAK